MNINEHFSASFASSLIHSTGYTPEELKKQLCILPPDPGFPLLQVLAHGTIHTPAMFSSVFKPMDCFLLLYTQSGSGNLRIGKQVCSLTPLTLLFLDCHQRFCLNTTSDFWNYQIFFLTGEPLSHYGLLLPETKAVLRPVSAYSETSLHLEKLSVCCGQTSLSFRLISSNLLNSIITDCIIYQYSDESLPSAPDYLTKIKFLFDTAFEDNYTLDKLALSFHVNKYRLCREFSNLYGCSPIQYLNRKRISVAKNLLLTSDCTVREAGRRVGIENTSHFITLFKKYAGQTPMDYRHNNIL